MPALKPLAYTMLRLAQLVVIFTLQGWVVHQLAREFVELPPGGLSVLPARLSFPLIAGAFVSALETLLIAGVVMRQAYGKTRLDRWVRVHRTEPSLRLARVRREVLGSQPVIQVASRGIFAFTYGFFRPRVLVSTGLVNQVTDAELTAVLCHEKHHADRRDPLQRLIVSLLRIVLWFGLVGPRLCRRHLLCQELAADRAALRGSRREAVAGALLKVAATPQFAAATAGMHAAEVLEARVRQLERASRPVEAHGVVRHLRCAVLVLCTLVLKALVCWWICS